MAEQTISEALGSLGWLSIGGNSMGCLAPSAIGIIINKLGLDSDMKVSELRRRLAIADVVDRPDAIEAFARLLAAVDFPFGWANCNDEFQAACRKRASALVAGLRAGETGDNQ